MDLLLNMFDLYMREWDEILTLTAEHIYMSLTGVLIAVVIGIPVAIFMTKNETIATVIQTIINIIQTIPSLALLLMIMIILGLGYTTVIVALICYSFMPIIRNTYVGLENTDKNLLEAGIGMGMTPLQLLMKVKIPLAIPVILAGVRVALVVSIGIATVATLVGGGGLGDLIYRGIVTADDAKVLAGSIPAALLAIIFDVFFGKLEKKMSTKAPKVAI